MTDEVTRYLDRLRKLDECIESESLDLSYGYACQKSGYYLALYDLGIISKREADEAIKVACKKRSKLNWILQGGRDDETLF